jgi:hypothetical protein
LLAGARGFYLSLLERVFHVKILCLRAVISFRSSLLPIAFITDPSQRITLFGRYQVHLKISKTPYNIERT